MTLVECAVAMAVVNASMLAITLSTVAGHRQLTEAQRQALAIRMANDLLEEIAAAPSTTGGAERNAWGLDDFNGLVEAPGEVRDFLGIPYETGGYALQRSVSVSASTITLAPLGGVEVSGKTIVVTVSDADGRAWRISRFVPEPTL